MEGDAQVQAESQAQANTIKTVPVFDQLDDIYKDDGHGSLKKHEKRFQNLKDKFNQTYG